MKVFQIVNNFCHWHTPYGSAAEAAKHFPQDALFVEAPDHVFESWGYLDGEFIRPTAPEGYLYDDATGTFYREGENPPKPSATDAISAKIAALENESLAMMMALAEIYEAMLG